jgi:hypothetical protein
MIDTIKSARNYVHNCISNVVISVLISILMCQTRLCVCFIDENRLVHYSLL